MEKNEKLALLLKDKTGNFRGISSFLGATLVILLESVCTAHFVWRVLLGCAGEVMGRSRAWHVAGTQERVAVVFPPLVMGGRV